MSKFQKIVKTGTPCMLQTMGGKELLNNSTTTKILKIMELTF